MAVGCVRDMTSTGCGWVLAETTLKELSAPAPLQGTVMADGCAGTSDLMGLPDYRNQGVAAA